MDFTKRSAIKRMGDDCYVNEKKVPVAELAKWLPSVSESNVDQLGGYCEAILCFDSKDQLWITEFSNPGLLPKFFFSLRPSSNYVHVDPEQVQPLVSFGNIIPKRHSLEWLDHVVKAPQ